ALDLPGVQVHRQYAIHTGRRDQVGDHLRADRHARRDLAILPRVAEVRDHRGDTPGRRAPQRIGEQDQLHQVFGGRSAYRLDDEAIAAAHVLADLDHHFAVGKAANLGFTHLHAKVLRHLARERGIGVPGENLELVLDPVRHLQFPRVAIVVRSFNFRKSPLSLAGREGFEPSNARSKAWCLTSLATAQRIWIQKLGPALLPINTSQKPKLTATETPSRRSAGESDNLIYSDRTAAILHRTISRRTCPDFDFSSLRAGIAMLLMRFFAVNPSPPLACTAPARWLDSSLRCGGFGIQGRRRDHGGEWRAPADFCRRTLGRV